MADQGFDQVISAQNNSGHGTDLVGRNSKTKEVKVWEVKSTTTDRAPGLSAEQAEKGGAKYTNERLGRAASGFKNYGKVPEAMANGTQALEWIKAARSKGCAHNPRKARSLH